MLNSPGTIEPENTIQYHIQLHSSTTLNRNIFGFGTN